YITLIPRSDTQMTHETHDQSIALASRAPERSEIFALRFLLAFSVLFCCFLLLVAGSSQISLFQKLIFFLIRGSISEEDSTVPGVAIQRSSSSFFIAFFIAFFTVLRVLRDFWITKQSKLLSPLCLISFLHLVAY